MVDLRSSNPYAPPSNALDAGSAAASDGSELATPRVRLASAAVDGLLVGVPLVPAMALAAWYAATMFVAVREAGIEGDHPPPLGSAWATSTVVTALVVGVLLALAISVYQWMLIARTGQSLGKKWMGARIERVDGAPVTFASAVVVRSWVFRLVGAIPYLGWAFHVIDCLCIFREDRRCLHDHLAGTRVVRAERT